jgi:hypothetical protein
MPRGDGTGPDGTYRNCVPPENELDPEDLDIVRRAMPRRFYRLGRGSRRSRGGGRGLRVRQRYRR